MARDIENALTAAGKNLLTASLQQEQSVVFAFAKVGTGSVTDSEDISALSELKNPYTGHNAFIARKKITDTGALVVSVQFENSGLTTNMQVTEVGVYARLANQTDTDAILFSYMTMGQYYDLVLAESVATVQRVYDIPYVFNGSSGITVSISPYGIITNADTLDGALTGGNSSSANAGKVVRLNDDGKMEVDITGSSEKLGGQLPSYYATADHDHSDATTSKHGYMSTTDKSRLDTLNDRVNQKLLTSSSPTFAGLTVNGYIDGALFR